MASTVNTSFFFVNGILNTDGSGSKSTEALQNIIKGASDYNSSAVSVRFVRNCSAPWERLATESLLVIGGVGAVSYAGLQEYQDKGSTNTRLTGAVGALALGAAVRDYDQMQKGKNEIAETLAKSVSTFLDENDGNQARLVLHSQGADVGYMALEKLSKLKGRIKVIAIGPMVTIPRKMAAEVINFQFKDDVVSSLADGIFGSIMRLLDSNAKRDIINLGGNGGKGLTTPHQIGSYLENQQVQKQIQAFVG